jgi:hypothetical protein
MDQKRNVVHLSEYRSCAVSWWSWWQVVRRPKPEPLIEVLISEAVGARRVGRFEVVFNGSIPENAARGSFCGDLGASMSQPKPWRPRGGSLTTEVCPNVTSRVEMAYSRMISRISLGRLRKFVDGVLAMEMEY